MAKNANIFHLKSKKRSLKTEKQNELAIGGNTSGQTFRDQGTVYEAEIWNPETGEWRRTSRMSVPRNYHSIALLLADGRVLSAGGGYCGGSEFCNGASHQDGQVFSPPYLFNDDGSPATRPVISTGPDQVLPGNPFILTTDSPVAKFTMIRISSLTHAVNTDVRLHTVPFESTGNNQYRLTTTANGNILSPGYWMLFAVNDQGVPSLARHVKVLPAGAGPAPAEIRYVRLRALTEVNGNPWTSVAELNLLGEGGQLLDRSNWVVSVNSAEPGTGDAANAIDGDSATLWHTEWSSNPGKDNDPSHPHFIQVDLGTGTNVTGLRYTPRTPGANGRIADYEILVSTDGQNWSEVAAGTFPNGGAVQEVTFAVAGPDGFTSEATASGEISTFTATAAPFKEYQWSFGDGTPANNYSTEATGIHSYLAPGRYIVVLRVRDTITGAEDEFSAVHIVFDPRIEEQPAGQLLSSTSLFFQEAAGRLWVVNPDNDTVTSVATGTFQKSSEVAVGQRPVSIAPAGDNTVWVSNKRSATISIIDQDTAMVTGTINLPPHSAPHGLLIRGDDAYVLLEGTGQLAQLSVSGRSMVTSVDTIGSRHLAMSPDGLKIYTAAFITPPLPGEHTATPDVSAGARNIQVFDRAGLSSAAA